MVLKPVRSRLLDKRYKMLVIKFEKEYFVDLISLRLGFTAKKEKIYIDFVFLFISIYIYWLYLKSGNVDVIKGRFWYNIDQVQSSFFVESIMNYCR
jgi:hypothetical protein